MSDDRHRYCNDQIVNPFTPNHSFFCVRSIAHIDAEKRAGSPVRHRAASGIEWGEKGILLPPAPKSPIPPDKHFRAGTSTDGEPGRFERAWGRFGSVFAYLLTAMIAGTVLASVAIGTGAWLRWLWRTLA